MRIFKPIENFFKSKKIIDDYCLFNKRLFNKLLSNKKKGEILVEFNAFQPFHIGSSIMSNLLANKFSAKINSYIGFTLLVSPLKYTYINILKWQIGNYFNLKTFKIYRSFNTTNIFYPKIDKQIELEAKIIVKKFLKKTKTKDDILKLKIKKIPIGDLLYDTYLKKNFVPTINLNDQKFNIYIEDYIKLTLFWIKYFKLNNVKAVMGSHGVYSYGIPLRVAAYNNIPAYVLSAENCFKVTRKRLYYLSDSVDYKKIINSLSKEKIKEGKNLAKQKLKNKFRGKLGHMAMDDVVLRNSSFKKKMQKSLIKKSKKIKILICPHDFSDSVHIHGKNFFSDMYEWLEFLGKLSNQNKYDWYIKPHTKQPGKFKIYQSTDLKILKKIIKKYKNIKILPANYSHLQIIKEKIDVVLTVYGSVSFEYPFFNIPVIDASKNVPFKFYKFSIIPKSKRDYKKKLHRLDRINYKKNEDEILEYYFARFIYNDATNWLFDFASLLKTFKTWDRIFHFNLYKHYVNNFNMHNFEKKKKLFLGFINSKEYRIRT